MSEFSIGVSVQLEDTSQLEKLKTDLDNMSNKPVKINLDLGNAEKQINNLVKQLQTLNKTKFSFGGANGGFNGAFNGINNIQKAVGELGKINVSNTTSQISNMQKTLKSLKFDNSSIDTITKDLSKLDIAVNKVSTKMNGKNLDIKVTGTDQLGRTVEIFKQFDSASGNFSKTTKTITSVSNAAKQAAEQMKAIGKIDTKFGNKGFSAEISNVESQMAKLSNASKEVQNSFKNLKTVYSEMEAIRNQGVQGNEDKMIAKNKEYEQSLKKVQNLIKQNANAEKQAADATKLMQNKQSLNLKMESWLKNNTRAAKQFGNEVKQLQSQLQSADKVQFNGIKGQFEKITLSAKAAGLEGQTVGQKIQAKLGEFGVYATAAMAFQQVSVAVRGAYDNVMKIDTAMTELKKVTDETNTSYNNFLTNAATNAKEIGTTIDDYITSTADFARLGYNFNESQELAKNASIYSVVGDDVENIETATQSMISTMKAFNIQADDSVSVVDKFNEVSNNFAISSGGIGDAMQNAASSLATGGNDIDQSIAMITAAM